MGCACSSVAEGHVHGRTATLHPREWNAGHAVQVQRQDTITISNRSEGRSLRSFCAAGSVILSLEPSAR